MFTRLRQHHGGPLKAVYVQVDRPRVEQKNRSSQKAGKPVREIIPCLFSFRAGIVLPKAHNRNASASKGWHNSTVAVRK